MKVKLKYNLIVSHKVISSTRLQIYEVDTYDIAEVIRNDSMTKFD